jgi:hypothetical protein
MLSFCTFSEIFFAVFCRLDPGNGCAFLSRRRYNRLWTIYYWPLLSGIGEVLLLGNSTIEVRKWVHGRDIGRFIRSLIFFTGFLLYLLLIVDLRLIYHGAGEIINFPSFFKGWAFFREFVSHPGGPVEYISAFLSQLFYIGWAGAFVATLQAWLICACIGYFIKAINYPRFHWVRYIPTILLLIIYTQYTYHFISIMALLAALIFVCLYLKLTAKNQRTSRFRMVVFLILSVILYYLAGAAYLLFALLFAIYEMLFRGHWLTGLLCLLLSAVIPYVEGVLVFNNSIIGAFSDLLPFSGKFISHTKGRRMITMVYLIYLLFPLASLVLGFWQIFVKLATKRKHKEQDEKKPVGRFCILVTSIYSMYYKNDRLRWIIGTLVLFGIAVGVVFISYDTERKALFEVDYYSCHKMWPQVLESAKRYPNDYFVIHQVNRALYHTGRFNIDMFSYPQHTGTLFLTVKGTERAYWKKFDLYIDLGLMNKAQSELDGCLNMFGERPLILKRLAFVNMVKGNIDSARIYLGILGKTLFDAKWAENYLDLLQSDPNLVTDSKIQHLRSLMLEKDYAFIVIDIEDILSPLLEKSRHNRMAFEYMMASFMLSGQSGKFVQRLNRLDDFGYTQIPRLYEEAILVHLYRTRKPINLFGRQLTSESKQRFKDFSQTYRNYDQNKEKAFRELANKYGDSYLFYCVYGFSGMKEWSGTQ